MDQMMKLEMQLFPLGQVGLPSLLKTLVPYWSCHQTCSRLSYFSHKWSRQGKNKAEGEDVHSFQMLFTNPHGSMLLNNQCNRFELLKLHFACTQATNVLKMPNQVEAFGVMCIFSLTALPRNRKCLFHSWFEGTQCVKLAHPHLSPITIDLRPQVKTLFIAMEIHTVYKWILTFCTLCSGP